MPWRLADTALGQRTVHTQTVRPVQLLQCCHTSCCFLHVKSTLMYMCHYRQHDRQKVSQEDFRPRATTNHVYFHLHGLRYVLCLPYLYKCSISANFACSFDQRKHHDKKDFCLDFKKNEY